MSTKKIKVFKKKSQGSRRRLSVYRADGDRFTDLYFFAFIQNIYFQL